MLQILSVLIIHSSPFDEIAQGPAPPKGSNGAYSLEGGKTVQVDQIQFSGNQAISTKQLQRLLSPYKNRMINETDLKEIKERIVLLYKTRGYDNVKVSIPLKQKSKALQIVIVEGKKSH